MLCDNLFLFRALTFWWYAFVTVPKAIGIEALSCKVIQPVRNLLREQFIRCRYAETRTVPAISYTARVPSAWAYSAPLFYALVKIKNTYLSFRSITTGVINFRRVQVPCARE